MTSPLLCSPSAMPKVTLVSCRIFFMSNPLRSDDDDEAELCVLAVLPERLAAAFLEDMVVLVEDSGYRRL